jgi:predicted transcriptional regulator
MAKKRTSFALSEAALEKLKELAEKDNRSQAAMLEKLIREAK